MMINHKHAPVAAVLKEDLLYPLTAINTATDSDWPVTIDDLLRQQLFDSFTAWYQTCEDDVWETISSLPREEAVPLNLLLERGVIWGIGFNYQPEHEAMPDEAARHPVSFIKPWSTLSAPFEPITLPPISTKTTGEAEIAVVIKKTCRQLAPGDVMDCIAGYTAALDMTEAAIHAENPRFLARAKSFDTYLALGTVLQTPDECTMDHVRLRTIHNGETVHENHTGRMLMTIADIIAYFSQGTTLHPGDVVLTGTPGPAVLRDGDTIRAEIDGLYPLVKTVRKEHGHDRHA